MRYDGQAWSSFAAVATKDGTLKAAGSVGYEVPVDVCIPVAEDLFVVCADSLTLLKEADFHATRGRIVFRSLFSNNGDIMEFIRNGVVIACFVFALMAFMQVQGLGGSLSHISSALDALKAGK